MSSSLTTKAEDAFVTRGYTNWKDASGEKQGGFPIHERSQVCGYSNFEFINWIYVYMLIISDSQLCCGCDIKETQKCR